MYISSEIRLSKNKEFLNDIEYWVERPCKSAGAFFAVLEKENIMWYNMKKPEVQYVWTHP